MNEPRLAGVELPKLGGGIEVYHLLAHFCMSEIFHNRKRTKARKKQKQKPPVNKNTHTRKTFETENCSERKGLWSHMLARDRTLSWGVPSSPAAPGLDGDRHILCPGSLPWP